MKFEFYSKKTFIIDDDKGKIYESKTNKTSVFVARDRTLNDRSVILKKVGYEDSIRKKQIENEIKIQAMLGERVDSIPKIYNFFDDSKNKVIYIEMQYIEGKSLEEYETESHDPKEKHRLFLNICKAVADIHNCKINNLEIVHRDLKPQNIIVKKDNSVCILDFGISGFGAAKRGTERYCAPEQRKNNQNFKIRQSTDVFALGLIGYELFSGEQLIYGKDYIDDGNSPDWILRTDISEKIKDYEISKIIKKAISKDQKKRYENAYKMYSELKRGNKNGRQSRRNQKNN